MYNRRSSPSLARWLSGLAIVVVAVLIFVAYQAWHQPPVALGPIQTDTPAFVTRTPTTAQTQPSIAYRIVSAEANLSAPIIELYYAKDADNWDLTYLASSAGHLEGTPELGKGGNFVLAGHVELKDGSRGPFADLKSLQSGNRITIIGDTQPKPTVLTYVVTGVEKVAPSDFSVIRNHGYEELTLITCDDWNQQTQVYDSRVIVHARLAASLVTATATVSAKPGARPTLTPTAKIK